MYFQNGFSTNHTDIEAYLGYLFREDIEVGLGIGFHTNFLDIPASNTFALIDVESYPIFVSGKYFVMPQYIRKPYVKLTVGYNNNSKGLSLSQVSSGPMFEAGLGVAFSSKRKTKFFMELLQYSSYAKGSIPNINVNSLSDIDFDVWFNQIVFKFGMFIGK
jgi:hypothetical protein